MQKNMLNPFTTKAVKSGQPEMANFFLERPKAANRKGYKKMHCIPPVRPSLSILIVRLLRAGLNQSNHTNCACKTIAWVE